MFSLIITIISIALVAVLALATLFYGGQAFNKGSADAEAAKLLLQGQQLLAAAELYRADFNAWPSSMQDLLDNDYLKTVPTARVTLVNAATAAETEWELPAAEQPMFKLEGDTGAETCAAFNQKASLGMRGVLEQAYPSLATQCFGDGAFTVLVRKDTTGTVLADAGLASNQIAVGAVPTDPLAPEWSVPPAGTTAGGGSGGGGSGGGAGGTVDNGDGTSTTRGLRYENAYSFGQVEVGSSGEYNFYIENNGSTPLEFVSAASSNEPLFAVSPSSCDGAVLAPGDFCDVYLQFAPDSEAAFTANLTISASASGEPFSVVVPLTGTGKIWKWTGDPFMVDDFSSLSTDGSGNTYSIPQVGLPWLYQTNRGAVDYDYSSGAAKNLYFYQGGPGELQSYMYHVEVDWEVVGNQTAPSTVVITNLDNVYGRLTLNADGTFRAHIGHGDGNELNTSVGTSTATANVWPSNLQWGPGTPGGAYQWDGSGLVQTGACAEGAASCTYTVSLSANGNGTYSLYFNGLNVMSATFPSLNTNNHYFGFSSHGNEQSVKRFFAQYLGG